MSEKSAKYPLDIANLPALTAREKAELASLAAKPDSEVDTSDIAPPPDAFWENAEQGRFYQPEKKVMTVLIDVDVLAWLQSQGKGYQAKINAILRRAMRESLKG